MDLVVAVLGRPAVLSRRATAVISTPKYQTCLCLLALRHPHPVHVDDLAEAVWGSERRGQHPKRLVGEINKIGRDLLEHTPIVGTGQGGQLVYRFDPNLKVITDVAVFETLADQVEELFEQNDHELCYALATTALSLWSSPPDDPFPGLIDPADASHLTRRRRAIMDAFLYAGATLGVDLASDARAALRDAPDSRYAWASLVLSLLQRGHRRSAEDTAKEAMACFGVTDRRRLPFPLSSACNLVFDDADGRSAPRRGVARARRGEVTDEGRWRLLRSQVAEWDDASRDTPERPEGVGPDRYALPLRATVEPDAASAEEDDRVPLLEWVVDRIPRTHAVLLFGESGSGKTWFLDRLLRELPDGYGALKIDLGGALRPPGHPEWPWDWSAILHGVPELESRVLLLDSLDDAVRRSGPGERLTLLSEALRPTLRGARVVVASRPHMFETSEELSMQVEALIERLSREGLDHPQVSVAHIVDFSSSDVRAFLEHEYPDDAERIWDGMWSAPGLVDLATRPILLPMVAHSVHRGLRTPGGPLPTSAGKMYRVHMTDFLSADAATTGVPEPDARRFLEELALYFLDSRTSDVAVEDLHRVAPSFFDWCQMPFQYHATRHALRSIGLLAVDPQGNLSFAHPSVGEYFAAEPLARSLTTRKQVSLAHFPSKTTDSLMIDLLLGASRRAWESLTSMVSEAEDPIVRYLCIYLTNRLVRIQPDPEREAALVARLEARLTAETTPFVVRELLVALTLLGRQIDGALVARHLDNPIPREVIAQELTDYYGSLEEARGYLRQQLTGPTRASLHLFYLISLIGIATDEDVALIKENSRSDDIAAKYVADSFLAELGWPAGEG